MTKERMERLMELYQGIGVETEDGQRYFYEAFGLDFEGAVKRVNHTFIGHKFGKYKVFIAQSEEVERMTDIRGEEVIIYKTKDGDVVSVLDGEAIRVWESVDRALEILYKAGWIFE
ncbi:MAG: hypothetical protein IKO36_05945 [Bacteroidaceae bacterium]|nr:hypothetical protein [Bacteroidaceae bacterium]